MLTKRSLLKAMTLASGLSLMGLKPAQAADVIHVVVPFPPGGGGDTLARSVTDKIAEILGDTLVVNNRPGAGGMLGTGIVARATPDGKTVGYVTNGIMCVNEYLYPMTFDAQKDLTPVGQLSQIGLIVAINPKALPGVKSVPDLIAYAKAHPGQVDFASAGIGTTSHLAGLLLEKVAGVKLHHIPHKGGAAAIMNVMAGRIPLIIDVSPNVLSHLDPEKLVALAVTTPERLSVAPELPTMKELGYPKMQLAAWDGFVVPKGTDPRFIEKFNAALETALKDPEVQKRLKAKAAEVVFSTPQSFEAFIQSERPKWKSLAETIDLKN